MSVRFLFFVGFAACGAPVLHAPDEPTSAFPVDTATTLTEASTPSAAPTGAVVPLVDADAWTVAELGADPFPEHQPEEILCDGLGLHPEDSAFEVETTYCNYALLEQTLPVDVPAGAELEVLFSHGPLNWTEPTEAHAALTIDGQVLWERTVPIPAEGWFYPDVVVVEHGVPAGSNVTFHCHNHGANSYRLYGVNWLQR